jgi:hypothetical protein
MNEVALHERQHSPHLLRSFPAHAVAPAEGLGTRALAVGASGDEAPEMAEKLDPIFIPPVVKWGMVRLKIGGVPEPRRLPSRLRTLRRARDRRPRTDVSVFQDNDSSVSAPKMPGVRVSPMSRMRRSPMSRSTTLRTSLFLSRDTRHGIYSKTKVDLVERF